MFKKGYTPWNKGVKMSDKGYILWNKGRTPWNKGLTKQECPNLKGNTKPRTEATKKLISIHSGSRRAEVKAKLSLSHRNQIPWNKGLTIADPRVKKSHDKMINALKGKHISDKHKLQISLANKGRHLSEETKNKMRIHRLHQIFPNKDTIPELEFQRFLIRLNIQFRTHEPLMGQPDIFIEPNICIFIDGDYWHNLWYVQKRDAEVNNVLQKQGYKVIRIWEHEIVNKKNWERSRNEAEKRNLLYRGQEAEKLKAYGGKWK